MAAKDSIIDHRNIGRLYTTWLALLIVTVGLGVLAYTLQYTTPFLAEKKFTLLYIVVIISSIAAILAVLFKYIFKREVIAWIFSASLAGAGLCMFLVYGWHWAFVVFFGAALLLLIILGPYLYFD